MGRLLHRLCVTNSAQREVSEVVGNEELAGMNGSSWVP